MENFKRPEINITRNLKRPNIYTQGLEGEFREYAFSEERAPLNKGKWRSEIFKVEESRPMDLEVGTGNGTFFQHHCLSHPDRCVVGIELKYKPLIQTIRGALKKGAKNGRVCRYHAFNIDLLFASQELNDVYIHFSDPWVSPRKPKNRVLNPRMLEILWDLQRPGSIINFKTDSREMYLWCMEHVRASKYKIEFETLHLHSTPESANNFKTQFEKIFISQGIEINYARLRRV